MEADNIEELHNLQSVENGTSGKKRKRKSKKQAEDSASPSSSPKKTKKKEKKEKKKKSKKVKKQTEVETLQAAPPAPTVVSPVTSLVSPTKEQIDLLKSTINTGINFDQYDNIPIDVFPAVFEPIKAFAEAPLGDALQKVISIIGYTKPTPVQKHALPIILGGRDLMASAQTGSGKTAAFLFPIISSIMHNDYRQGGPKTEGFGRSCCAFPLAVVLAPTRELAVQIYEEARKFTTCSRLTPVVVYGGVPYTPQARLVERGVDIIIATPGRLQDMVDRGKVSLSKVQFLCLDEADRMLDMGFEPQIRAIVEGRDMPAARRTVMFSATFPKEIRKLATDFLAKDYIMLKVGRVGSTTESIVQKIRPVADNGQKMALIKEELAQLGDDGRCMVFVETKRTAAKLATDLRQQGHHCTAIHGDISQMDREAALRSFRAGKVKVLIGTSVAARGLDIDNVTHVINYDLPDAIDDYVHRIGRTGRAGNTGLAIAFFSVAADRNLAKPLVKILSESGQEVPDWLMKEAGKPRQKGPSRGRGRGRWGGGKGGGGGRNGRPQGVAMKGGRRGGGGGGRRR